MLAPGYSNATGTPQINKIHYAYTSIIRLIALSLTCVRHPLVMKGGGGSLLDFDPAVQFIMALVVGISFGAPKSGFSFYHFWRAVLVSKSTTPIKRQLKHG